MKIANQNLNMKNLNDDSKREDIIRVLSTFDWKEYLNCIAMRKIQQFHIVDVLKKNVKEKDKE